MAAAALARERQRAWNGAAARVGGTASIRRVCVSNDPQGAGDGWNFEKLFVASDSQAWSQSSSTALLALQSGALAFILVQTPQRTLPARSLPVARAQDHRAATRRKHERLRTAPSS
jgi:hypothetical protein